MNKYEKEEISEINPKYRPIGAWGYFGYNILFALPVIGFFILIICCFSSSNINRRSYARSFFCGFVLLLIIVLIAIGLGGGVILEYLQNILQSMQQ